jgi:nuclear RNA export factor
LFPTLKLLDGEELLDEIEFGIGDAVTKLPVTTKVGFCDSDVTLATSHGFLAAYFEHFDGNRSYLANFYEHNSVFSLTISNKGSISKMSRYDYEKLFKAWEPHNRNLIKVKQADKRFNSIHIGPENIINTFNQFPGTKHPLEDPPEARKFVFDSYQQGSGTDVHLFIYLHGEFTLVGTTTKRSFDRTFILVPALPGSRAASAGLPASILNDSMVIRTYGSNHSWKSAETLPVSVPVPPLELLKQLQLAHSLVKFVNYRLIRKSK